MPEEQRIAMEQAPGDETRPLAFTPRARERILEFIEKDGAEGLAVRIRVVSPSPLNPRYELSLVEPAEVVDQDRVFPEEGFDVVADPESARLLEGASVDWVETLTSTGFKVENPNLKPLGSEPLEGPLAERVARVIDEQINPAVASHGGRIHLVDVREGTVYVRMSGGCQGCGMATVTLTQGIRKMILEAIPEIDEIEDVTNHRAGTNPYF